MCDANPQIEKQRKSNKYNMRSKKRKVEKAATLIIGDVNKEHDQREQKWKRIIERKLDECNIKGECNKGTRIHSKIGLQN